MENAPNNADNTDTPVTRVEMEQLLSDQADVILEAVDERLEKKLGEKIDPVINKLDCILKGIEDLSMRMLPVPANFVATMTS